MRFLFALALATSAPAPTVPPPAGPSLPLNVGGRVLDEGAGGFRFGWPGVYFEGRFRGNAIRVRFDAPQDHMRLLVDGEERGRFERAGDVDLTLGNLPAGEHLVRLEKLTESQTGGGRFLGFYPTRGGVALAAPRRARQIEYIGDSLTVGYGNTSPTRECSARDVHDTTDTQQAFGPLVARRFDADYRIVAYSGFGIVRNYAGREPALSLPILYPRLVPDDAAHLEEPDPQWRPQIVVVNLGSNDFSTPLHAGERWSDQAALRADYRRIYADFLRRLAARQPQAHFILMGSDVFFADVDTVAATLPERVTTLRFGELDRGGCDWHPSLADHRRLADELASHLARTQPGWQVTRGAREHAGAR